MYKKYGAFSNWNDTLRKQAEPLIAHLPKKASVELTKKVLRPILEEAKKDGRKAFRRKVYEDWVRLK